MKLALIGGGTMGEAMIAGVLKKELATADDISVCEIIAGRRDHLAQTYGVSVADEATVAARQADIVVLAVKPQEFATASKDISGRLTAGQTVMSIMAGVAISAIQESLKSDTVIRAIPNTPAQIGEGMTIWTATAAVSGAARETAAAVLSALGQEIYVADEKYIDMATAISSSGPAYIFLVIEAMIDAAVHIGLRRDMAAAMVLQTVIGSARYAHATGKHPAELRNQVTSPGGTTTEGLLVLEEAGLRAAFIDAVQAAYEKARSLGG